MDEFCANKDSQLKRCACSTRIHDFDKTKKQLSQVEDKLLDFNQRLLTVNMDKEDAEALFTATEGELAYEQKDTSASQKILNEITKKLKSGENDSFNQNLSAISLSLNTDAAFDNVDSLLGASTTSKEGVSLYNAALPVCREMAAEVCDEQALAIAESGYQMMIEQDCNTVAKSYENQTDQAREKIREGSALLDISRLDIYQKRNSDDILTCKKKMLNQLYNTSVCGENLSKCLDISGKYIDPLTGQAILTADNDLANLATLITRPDGNQKWTTMAGNERFVSYLQTKKKFLEPAMENCQDISDYVWEEFLEDALAQIKLAQDSKLEEVRQSCTTLTTQCLSDTAKSLSDFDARALSIFGVAADKTVNEMCASVKNSCTALLESTGDVDKSWIGGMTQIATEKTYETIMQTCREVGRACIIQACKSISGNFGMCESIQNSVNRKAIINRTSCWAEVQQCIAAAGEDAINRIFEQKESLLNAQKAFYTDMYGNINFILTNDNTECLDTEGASCIYDICKSECTDAESYECRKCRLAEKIWGNCEGNPISHLNQSTSHNKIIIPTNDKSGTLLAWFAQNTGTANESDSCRDTSCPAGYISQLQSDTNTIICTSSHSYSSDGAYCQKPDETYMTFPVIEGFTNCCRVGTEYKTQDNEWGALTTGTPQQCCIGGAWKNAKTIGADDVFYGTTPSKLNVCSKQSNIVPVASFENNNTKVNVVCITSVTDNPIVERNDGLECKDGYFVYVDTAGRQIDPHNTQFFMSYTNAKKQTCKYKDGKWKSESGEEECDTPSAWKTSAI